MNGRPTKGITFWDRVYSQVMQRGECVEFTGCKDDCGYGRINKDGKLVRVHRAVFERDNGLVRDGFVVRHTCDNPACINPAHLVIGTQADNIADMDARGRRVTLIGSQHSHSKLKESQIPEIRSKLASGVSCERIGAEYGVSSGLIRHIKKGRIWRHA